jgi:hypothetical protein
MMFSHRGTAAPTATAFVPSPTFTAPRLSMTASVLRLLPKNALNAALTLLIGCAFAGGASAQEDEDYKDTPKSTTMTGSAAAAAERARQRKAEAAKKANQQPERYPLATRKPPERKTSSKEGKIADEILAAYDAKQYADAIAKVDAATAESKNAYLQSYFYQLAADAWGKQGDEAKSADYYRKAVDANGLDNNGHYQIMFNLAVILSELDRDADSLTYLDRFMTETKTETEQAVGLKAYLFSKLGRAAEGAALYEKMLTAKPGDMAILINAVALYQQAENSEKANALLESARKQGLLKEANHYRILFNSYANANKYKEAQEVLEDGVAKGVIPPSQTLANDYSIIAQNYLAEEKGEQAIDFYRRAAKVATNGEAALNLARLLKNEDRIGEAKAAAREALAKGVKKPNDANNILAMPGK